MMLLGLVGCLLLLSACGNTNSGYSSGTSSGYSSGSGYSSRSGYSSGSGQTTKYYCEVCSRAATHTIVGITGQIEHYCTQHYNEMEDIYDMMMESLD